MQPHHRSRAPQRRRSVLALVAPLLAGVAVAQQPDPAPPHPAAAPAPPQSGQTVGRSEVPPAPIAAGFVFPCDRYRAGLRGWGNFGVLITRADSPFRGTHHLAEDVWLPAGLDVRAIGDGVVRYSDFSPSWRDERGRMHWNLGNVIVVEHGLDPARHGGMTEICSVYVHLAADRRVQVGDTVTAGEVIGRIGADRSEENGDYPVHLHFGIHRGPYFQVAPAWRAELEDEARTTGLQFGAEVVRGEIELVQRGPDTVEVRPRSGGPAVFLSLLMGSSHPTARPADLIGWCSGYGPRRAVDDWLRPSAWIEQHRLESGSGTGRPR
ncbi:MAG: M23 family metallopeptidase [Planctomycetota bacterium]